MEQQRMRKAQQKFKLRGLTLTSDALRAVIAYLNEQYLPDEESLEQLVGEVDKISFKKNVLNKDAILELISAVTGSTNVDQNVLHIVDAFKVPKICYDSIRKLFYAYTGALSIHAEAGAKAGLYKNRLQLLQQRVVRDRHFAKPAFDVDGSQSGNELASLQSLIGCAGRRWVMGIISQLEDGRFYLEDMSATMPLDFSQAKITTGLFTENCIIVAEGILQTNGIFQILTCGFPPLEDRGVALTITAGLDFFGAGVLSHDEVVRLEQLEKKAVNDMFIILSDVLLDEEQTIQKLETVLDAFESVDVVPSVFVLMGNFSSHPCNLASHRLGELRSNFGRLGSLIAAHPRIKENSRIILVPGPEDPGPSTVLPRPALPKYFTDEVKKHVPNATFASNPCRIRFFSQEIVLFRENLLYRMRRSCIVTPSQEETSDPFEHLVATVLHQSHLCPLPLTTQPIIWDYDHSLWLYPTPHTIVLADRSEQKLFKYAGVTCFNPGSLSLDGTFVVYRPASQETELSAV